MTRQFRLQILDTLLYIEDTIDFAGNPLRTVKLSEKSYAATGDALPDGGLIVTAALAHNAADEGYRTLIAVLPPVRDVVDVYPTQASVTVRRTWLTPAGPASQTEVFLASGTVEVLDIAT